MRTSAETAVLDQYVTDRVALYQGDCCQLIKGIPDESIDFSVYSPPFSSLYIYSDSEADMGNAASHAEFFDHYRFLLKELWRTAVPGTLTAVHCKDLPLFKGRDGAAGLYRFPDKIADAHEECGWIFHSRICVWKDPVIEMQRTKNHGLLYKQLRKDSRFSRAGMADHVLVFRKWVPGLAEFPRPVTHTKEEFPLDRWQRVASPVWDELECLESYDGDPQVLLRRLKDAYRQMGEVFRSMTPAPVLMDIRQPDVLNCQAARENADEKHICLARGSLVLTRMGYKPIQDVEVGELVFTHKGRWMPVTAVQNTGVRRVVKVRAQGVPGLILTPEHKLWTRKVRNTPSAQGKARREATNAEPSWVPASETKGSYINLKLPEAETPAISDEAFWWIVGRWIACGHIDLRDTAVISCGYHKLEELLPKLGEFAGNPRDTGTAWQIPLTDPGQKLRGVLKACGCGAANKHIPAEGYTLPVEQAKALLDGYLSGDGCYLAERNRWLASSVSKELLLGIAMLAQRVYGAVASIYAGRAAGTHVIQGRTVNTQQDWILCFDLPGERMKPPFILPDGSWRKVRAIEDAGEVETWNLRVAEDESFTAEGCIVKNCPLQIGLIEWLLEMYGVPGGVVLSPFAGIGSEVVTAMRRGYQAVGFELKRSYWEQARHHVRQAETVSQQLNLWDLLEVA